MSRRETTKRETRQLIQEASRQLFLTRGPERCTMRDIARKAGVSPASVVVHFKNKTALLEAALYEDIERTMTEAVLTMPRQACLHDRLIHIARSMYGFYDTNRELYRVLIRDTVFEPKGDNPCISGQLEHYLHFFSTLIEEEKLRGAVRSDTDGQIAAASLFSLYFSVLMEFLRTPDMTLNLAVERLSAISRQHLSGILPPKSEK